MQTLVVQHEVPAIAPDRAICINNPYASRLRLQCHELNELQDCGLD